jgi:glutamyl-tRNA synthetase
LIHWQKETLARLPSDAVLAWLGSSDSSEFVELIRHNVVLPGDASPWRNVVRGALPPFSTADAELIAAAGADFFGAALDNLQQANGDFKLFAKLLKEKTGRKGADLFMPLRLALTGQTHGPELAPLFKLMPLEVARGRLQAALDLC